MASPHRPGRGPRRERPRNPRPGGPRHPRRRGASTRTKQNRALAALWAVAVLGVMAVVASSNGATPAVTTASAGAPPATPRGGPAPTRAAEQQAGPTTAPGTTAPTPAGAVGISLSAVGDTVMGTPEFGLPPAGGSTLFTRVKPLLTGDVVLGNLEEALATGPSTKCGSGSGGSCYAFASPPSYARNLRSAGFTAMSVANNHSYDWGPAGLRSTERALAAVGIIHTGRPGQIAVQTTNAGAKVAMIGVAPYPWSQNALNIPGTVALVRQAARMAPIVVVSAHVGAEGSAYRNVPRGPEQYLGEPRGDTRALARAVVDAGADLFVGHGPHVMRGMEFRKGRLIAYSLGNFLGYKTFSTAGYAGQAGVLQVKMAPDGAFTSGRIAPTRMNSEGIPSPGGSTAQDVAALSRADFGRTAARVSRNGTITPPPA
jgi:hypothetical protein